MNRVLLVIEGVAVLGLFFVWLRIRRRRNEEKRQRDAWDPWALALGFTLRQSQSVVTLLGERNGIPVRVTGSQSPTAGTLRVSASVMTTLPSDFSLDASLPEAVVHARNDLKKERFILQSTGPTLFVDMPPEKTTLNTINSVLGHISEAANALTQAHATISGEHPPPPLSEHPDLAIFLERDLARQHTGRPTPAELSIARQFVNKIFSFDLAIESMQDEVISGALRLSVYRVLLRTVPAAIWEHYEVGQTITGIGAIEHIDIASRTVHLSWSSPQDPPYT